MDNSNKQQLIDKYIQIILKNDIYTSGPATNALIEIGEEAVDSLLMHISNKNYLTKMFIVKALGKIGDPKAIEALIHCLHNEDVQDDAIRALGNFGPEALKQLMKVINDNNNDLDIRRAAIKVLGEIGDSSILDILIMLLMDTHEDIFIRIAVIDSLGQIGDSIVLEDLLLLLMDTNKDEDIRKAAIEALGQIGDKRAINPLLIYLNDEKFILYVISSLGEIGHEQAIEPLIDCLFYKSSSICEAVSVAISNIGKAAFKPLLNLLKNHDIHGERILDEVDGFNIKIDFSKRNKIDIEAVIYALGQIGDKRATTPLINLLFKNLEIKNNYCFSSGKQDAIIRALGDIGDSNALPELMKLKDMMPIGYLIQEAIEQIANK